jgi:hypothetical protein
MDTVRYDHQESEQCDKTVYYIRHPLYYSLDSGADINANVDSEYVRINFIESKLSLIEESSEVALEINIQT